MNNSSYSEQGILDILLSVKLGKGESRVCPKCSNPARFSPIRGRASYACNDCGYHIAPLGGTVFNKSKTPVSKWLVAFYLLTVEPDTSILSLQYHLNVNIKVATHIKRSIVGIKREVLDAKKIDNLEKIRSLAADLETGDSRLLEFTSQILKETRDV